MLKLRHETDDWVKITPSYNGVEYTGAFSYQIQPYGTDAASGGWLNAVTNVDGDKGADIQNLARGLYQIFVRIDGQTPYAPVLDPEPLLMT